MLDDPAMGEADVTTAARGRGRWARAELLAALAAIACYVNTLPNGFCLDDVLVVQLDPKVTEPGRWAAVWTTDYWSESADASPNRDLLYRPIAISSYRLLHRLAGTDPWPHHAMNIALHVLVCVLVAQLTRALCGTDPVAAVAGLFFAVLPIHTEAVAGIVGRADLLATAGVLLALLAHRRSMWARSWSRAAWWRGGAAAAAFAALGSKEAGLSLVPLTILCDAFWHGDSGPSTGDRRSWIRYGPWRLAYLLVPLAVYLGLRYYALGDHLYQQPPPTKTVNILVDAPPWQHALGVLQCFGMYWAKTIWPDVLSIKYAINAIRLATGVWDPHVLVGAAALTGLVAASVLAWRRGTRGVAVLSASIVLTYLPTSHAFVLMQVFFAERIWYLPSVWIAVLVGLAVRPFIHHPVCRIGLAVLLIAMMGRCWLRNSEWKDNGTLYRAAYRDQPDGVGALQLYGEWLVHHGRYERGVRLLGRAVAIDLGFTDAHRTLGMAHLQAGDLAAALRHLQIADYQVPGHPATGAALSRVSRELAQRDDDLAQLRRQAEEHAEEVEAQLALVRRLRDLGLVREALDELRLNDARFAGVAAWQWEYAVTMVHVNDRDGAIERYRRCLALTRDDPQVAVELAMLLLERRAGDDLDEAWRWANHASALAPHAPSVLACRAELTALRGDLAAALALYENAIQALPPDNMQRTLFEQRARALGRRPIRDE